MLLPFPVPDAGDSGALYWLGTEQILSPTAHSGPDSIRYLNTGLTSSFDFSGILPMCLKVVPCLSTLPSLGRGKVSSKDPADSSMVCTVPTAQRSSGSDIFSLQAPRQQRARPLQSDTHWGWPDRSHPVMGSGTHHRESDPLYSLPQ